MGGECDGGEMEAGEQGELLGGGGGEGRGVNIVCVGGTLFC